MTLLRSANVTTEHVMIKPFVQLTAPHTVWCRTGSADVFLKTASGANPSTGYGTVISAHQPFPAERDVLTRRIAEHVSKNIVTWPLPESV